LVIGHWLHASSVVMAPKRLTISPSVA